MEQWSIVIEAMPEKRNRFLKAIRKMTDVGLKEAVESYEQLNANLPCVLFANLERAEAEYIAKIFRARGTTVGIEVSSIPSSVSLDFKDDIQALKRPGGVFARTWRELFLRVTRRLFWTAMLGATLIVAIFVYAVLTLWNISEIAVPISMLFVGTLLFVSAFAWMTVSVPRLLTWTCAACGHDLRGLDEPLERCPECGCQKRLPPGTPRCTRRMSITLNVLAYPLVILGTIFLCVAIAMFFSM